MNDTSKAVIIEVTGGNDLNHYIDLRGTLGLLPDDWLGGSNTASAGKAITQHIGGAIVETDIDQTKAIFRERGAVRQPFEKESVVEGDLILIERTNSRTFRVSKASKRGFNCYL